MRTQNLGYPRIGSNRELKKACELYWSGNLSVEELIKTGSQIRKENWLLQKDLGIDLIPSNDFSFYDQVLDMSLTVGAIPERYNTVLKKSSNELDLYFAMARGYQKNGLDITAMEMTKWFDTNYHYIVPEFHKNQEFKLFSDKIINEFVEAKNNKIITKPVIIGPLSYLLLGKEKEEGFHRLDLIDNLLPVYLQLIKKLGSEGVAYIQFDEPCLSLDLGEKEKSILSSVYTKIKAEFPNLQIILASYFECYGENLPAVLKLPINVLHLDLVRCNLQLDDILAIYHPKCELQLSLGIVDGRNIWKNDFTNSLSIIKKATAVVGAGKLWISPSCSLIHSPCDLDLETNEDTLTPEIKQWLAFAKQKIAEVVTLKNLSLENPSADSLAKLEANKTTIESRKTSKLIHNQEVKERVNAITIKDSQRNNSFAIRKIMQREKLKLPLFPTTTIGSFPQTQEVRSWRAKFKKGDISA